MDEGNEAKDQALRRRNNRRCGVARSTRTVVELRPVLFQSAVPERVRAQELPALDYLPPSPGEDPVEVNATLVGVGQVQLTDR